MAIVPGFPTKVIHIRQSKDYPGAVYIGRPGRKAPNAVYGNPYTLGFTCPECGENHAVLKEMLDCYQVYLERKLDTDSLFAKQFYELKGKALYCFCRPTEGFKGRLLCHGQIMAAKLDGVKPEDVE